MIRVHGHTCDDDDDPIVWEVYGQRQCADGGIEFQHAVMRESDRRRLTDAFGPEWVDRMKDQRVAEYRAWERRAVGGAQ